MINTLSQDARYGLRGLAHRPGFTILAILTLALGIGAATTIFSVIQNVLLDPLPYLNADRVAMIQIHDVTSSRPGGRTFFELPEFLDLQEQNHVFDEVIGGGQEDVLLTTSEGARQFNGSYVTSNTFRFLGVPAAVGRGLTEDDARPGAPPVFVMAHKMWLEHYNLDPGILGRTFVLNGVPTTLVGIMPVRFTKLAADLWRPIALDRADPEMRSRFFMFQARLKPGVTLQQATADIEVIVRRLAQQYPRNYPKQFTVQAVNWLDSLVAQFRTTLYTLAAAVALLLLIACGNVANMLLARGASREKEMAIRASLGAARSRLIQQLLVESLLLAAGGVLLGCLFAYAGIKALPLLIPPGLIPREAIIRMNVPVLAFSLVIAAVTAIVFGLVPALQAARADMVEPLKDAGKGSGASFRGGRVRNALVIAEVALSLMLLVGAGLLMRSFVELQRVDLGLNPDNILVVRLPLPSTYETGDAKHRFFRTLLGRLHALPGVVAATETTSLPPYGGVGSELDIPGRSHTDRWDAVCQLVSEGYFPTLGTRLVRGRLLTEAEVDDARKVAVVNQTLVSRYFPNADPLGQRIRLNLFETLPVGRIDDPTFEIVGVIADVKNRGIQDPTMPEVIVPYTVSNAFLRGILVRTQGAPELLLNSVRREVWAVDRNVALTTTGSLKEFLQRFSYAEPQFSLVLLGVFAVVGLLLVAIGIYSVMAYTVSHRTHEIGIRIALGASRGAVMRMVARLGLQLVAIGAVIGLAGSIGATRVLTSMMFGVSPQDPLTIGAVILVMALSAAVACYVPARRATRVDPMVALRYE